MPLCSASFRPWLTNRPISSSKQVLRWVRRSRPAFYHSWPTQNQWQAGEEPGIKPLTDELSPYTSESRTDSRITAVDFNEDRIVATHLHSQDLPDWMSRHGTREPWSKCRWINVNGLNTDVVQILGQHANLHELAIEDMIHTEARTKVDWYSDQTYIALTLQRLIHLEGGQGHHNVARKFHGLRGFRQQHPRPRPNNAELPELAEAPEKFYLDRSSGLIQRTPDRSNNVSDTKMRTLQGLRGGLSANRVKFMEAHSVLVRERLCVSTEQVSIFLLADNTVLSFFERSANDVEGPLLARLQRPDTVLRQSCDASMVAQSIIDVIIDLAVPVVQAYQDAISSIEMDVLFEPSVDRAKDLYTISSEIMSMRTAIAPVAGLSASLRVSPNIRQEDSTFRGVSMTPLSHMYLRDVEDHCVLIVDAVDQLQSATKGMIDLIFNTITAKQNESMAQLTAVTILFLPLTLITGYFGMNFTEMPSLEHSELFSWYLAAPVVCVTIVLVSRRRVKQFFVSLRRRKNVRRTY